MNPDKFIEELSKHNIDLTEKQKKQFQLYFEDLIETNKHVNLTRITEEKDVYLNTFTTVLRLYLNLGMYLKRT